MIASLAVLAVIVIIVLALRRIGGARRSAVPSQGEIQRLIAANEILTAARMYRDLTGQGLRDAKMAVERIQTTGIWEEPPTTGPVGEDDTVVLTLVRENKIIEAVKIYRERHGVDLAAAKAAVDRISARMLGR